MSCKRFSFNTQNQGDMKCILHVTSRKLSKMRTHVMCNVPILCQRSQPGVKDQFQGPPRSLRQTTGFTSCLDKIKNENKELIEIDCKFEFCFHLALDSV